MKIVNYLVLSVLFLAIVGIATAQETEETVVDEVVAQINESVITLSQVNREVEIQVRARMGSGKTREVAEAEVANSRGELIAGLIEEEMIRQKGVEIGLEKTVESEVNQRLLRLTRENKLKSINDLYTVMRQQGVDPELLKKQWRAQIMRQQVLFNLVDRIVYWDTKDKELKEYFSKHKDKFQQQETVELSEIFLPFAGKNEADVIKLAESITIRARNGEDFKKLAVEYSERPNVDETMGYVGKFPTTELNDDIKVAIKGLKAGDIANPIRWDIGMEIVRVDSYIPASTESNFDEGLVRSAILREKGPAARTEFIRKLREDSYIKVRENYRAIVMPFLRDAPSTATSSSNN